MYTKKAGSMDMLSKRTISITTEENAGNRKKFLSLSFLHLANDLHSGVLPTIIPMLAQSISLSLAQAGVLNSVFGMIHLFGQPVFGYLSDKQKNRGTSP